ncbi:MAG: DUF4249 domain-containing protein, partial [Bacteroidota bacterium]|nr:DUF4249 domain-containing protein [Bacteroidota bacterium]
MQINIKNKPRQIQKIGLGLFILLGIIPGCITPFTPKNFNHESKIVIEGLITDKYEPYTVKLSRLAPMAALKVIPISDATVFITDEFGEVFNFNESDSGIYVSDPDLLQGEIGRSYQLTVETTNGNIYQSGFSEILAGPAIDSLYARRETIYNPNTQITTDGYQFYVKTQPSAEKNNYYMWSNITTYEYDVAFSIDYVYQGYQIPFSDPDSLKTCWKTEQGSNISIIHNDPEINTGSLTVGFFHDHISKFNIKYSLLLKQYAIDKETYIFYNELKKLNDNQGSFYDQQPYQIKGNLRNVNDSTEVIPGYFRVASVKEQRLFLNDSSYPQAFCLPYEGSARRLYFYSPSLWPFYVSTEGYLANETCFDC